MICMKVEYDPTRDLLYTYFVEPLQKATKTITIVPGGHADFDSAEKLIGIELIDASEIVGRNIEFTSPEVSHPTMRS
jgi:uncharacterized protein YuzE